MTLLFVDTGGKLQFERKWPVVPQDGDYVKAPDGSLAIVIGHPVLDFTFHTPHARITIK